MVARDELLNDAKALELRIFDPLLNFKPIPSVADADRSIELAATYGNEPYRFLIAWRVVSSQGFEHNLGCQVTAPGAKIEIYQAPLVPIALPFKEAKDYESGYLLNEPGLLPDPLIPVNKGVDNLAAKVAVANYDWNYLHVLIQPLSDDTDQEIPIVIQAGLADQWEDSVTLLDESKQEFSLKCFKSDKSTSLTKELKVSQWVHYDSIAELHGVAVWSEEHWELIEQYLIAAVEMGVSSTIIPIWTPPLDTAPGTYRIPTQLVKIKGFENAVFDFSQVKRFAELMVKVGMSHVETPPVFSQWGAKFAAPIYSDEELIYGWHTPSDDPEYLDTMIKLLKESIKVLANYFPKENIFTHISDEPGPETAEKYQNFATLLKHHITDLTTFDALSNPIFANLVDLPVVATDAAAAWNEPKWVYYCNAQRASLANRFIAQYPIRHRIIGAQLWLAGGEGFLHWGFNFYGRGLSLGWSNPWIDTSSGGSFASGDAFIVYPPAINDYFPHGVAALNNQFDYQAKEIPILSLRYFQLKAAFLDWNLFQLASETIGAAQVRKILTAKMDINYENSSFSALTYLEARLQILAQLPK